MRTPVTEASPFRWLRSEPLDEAIDLLTPIHSVIEATNKGQLIEKLYRLLLKAEKELRRRRLLKFRATDLVAYPDRYSRFSKE
jgi:hypothetical protein